jgi:hypothetical protein
VSDQYFDSMRIQGALRSLHQIAERQDIASLVLTLKELIPDYNPGSELLKAVLQPKLNHAGLAVVLKHASAPMVN